jgi:hydrogenase maturation factor
MLLFDAQTSGGLLLSVPAEKCEDLIAYLTGAGEDARRIGEAVTGAGIRIVQ